VREKRPSCPNCETVLAAHYEPDDAEGMWYECSICGYRIPAADFRSVESEDELAHRRAHAR